MHSYHIHIKGLVQGVGFRPLVCQMAIAAGLKGLVNNSTDGVHIYVNGTAREVKDFYTSLLKSPPRHSVITSHSIEETNYTYYLDFSIDKSDKGGKTELLLTPDMSICPECKNELRSKTDKRYHYSFTTCLHCGPRYSITKALPYDRENTSMAPYHQCPACKKEYSDNNDRRFYSQTNSCPDCAIPMHLYSSAKNCISSDPKLILDVVKKELTDGKIIAVKGLGGYLLLCDASNKESIQLLRDRKHRPSKPLAVLYPSVEMMKADLELSNAAIKAIESPQGPIVLNKIRIDKSSSIATNVLAPGLNKIGGMIPCTPLLVLISEAFNGPLVATSGNMSGAPIIYKDEEALSYLFPIADYILTYDREILAPQDDSVIQFNKHNQRIILRRSRGMAPNYFPSLLRDPGQTLLAMGSELKSAFAIQEKELVYVSQYLGDQQSFEAQESFDTSLKQLFQLLDTEPDVIVADKHPGYSSSIKGNEWATQRQLPFITIQHHEAHFAAVLAENNLLGTKEPVLGVIWDGTGYGNDSQIWGGEFFIYSNDSMERTGHINYFQQLLGDKMSREPRLSALSLLHTIPGTEQAVKHHFSEKEWTYYSQLLKQPDPLHTSSMGRLLDGIACLLDIKTISSYEGEAALLLEAMAETCKVIPASFYPLPFISRKVDWSLLISGVLNDLAKNTDRAAIAYKVFLSLAHGIDALRHDLSCNRIAFSGGVFQNALLTGLIWDIMGNECELYFHKQLSPNDECIGLGQIAHYHAISEEEMIKGKVKEGVRVEV